MPPRHSPHERRSRPAAAVRRRPAGGACRAINAKAATELLSRRTLDQLTEFVKGLGAKGLAWIKIGADPSKAEDWQGPAAKNITAEARVDLAKRLAGQLRLHKIAISIDDLGAEWLSLAGLCNFPFVELKVNHRPRLYGRSKYSITRTLRVVLDLLTVKFLSSYSTRPAHVFGPIGVIAEYSGTSHSPR